MFRKCRLAMLCAAVVMVPLLLSAIPPPAAGTAAPRFTLPSENGSPVSLQDYRGQWVVLYFYPKDFSIGCTLEARNFQHDLAKYKKLNAVILGVSVDSQDSHHRFCVKEGLRFKLLADRDFSVSKEYGVLSYKGLAHAAKGTDLLAPNGEAAHALRRTFLIAPDGRIALVFDSVNPATHSADVLAALRDLERKQHHHHI